MIILPTFRGCLASMTFSPSDISGLGLWLDAGTITGLSDGDAISTWNDLSGAGRNATGSGSARPTYETNELNGKPVVRGDGVDDYMSFAAGSLLQNVAGATLFAVLRWRSSPASSKNAVVVSTSVASNFARAALLGGTAGSGKWSAGGRRLDANSYVGVGSSTSINTASCAIQEAVFDYANSNLYQYINGTLDGSTTSFQTDGNTSDAASLLGTLFASYDGGSGAGFAGIDVAEILIWPSALSSGNRALVRAYLAAKYAISAA